MRNLSSAQPKYEDFPEEEIDEEPEEKSKLRLVESEKDVEQKMEKHEIKINTVADFVDALEWSYDLTEDKETQKKLGHQITKIEMSLNSAGFSADKVYVEKTPKGVLGLYYPSDRKTAVSKDLLEDFIAGQRFIAHVLYHERMHKKGSADEAVAEIKTKESIPISVQFYVSEQEKFRGTFHKVGRDKALSIYNIAHPDKLVDCYLEVELENNYKGKTGKLKKLENKRSLEFTVNKEAEGLAKKFKKGVPRLNEKLEQRNYSIKAKVREVLRSLTLNIN